MATIVCQGLPSCLQSQTIELKTISLKLSCSIDEKRCHYYDDKDYEKQISSTSATAADDDSHCWSFLQAISYNNGCKLESTCNKETTPYYVHPLDARSKLTLSDKSLELCTENLGSETGTDIIMEEDSLENNGGNSPRREHQEQQQQQKKKCAIKKAIAAREFPPPLTTIYGVSSLRVRPYREDGRLIIEATKAPSPWCPLFQAERSDGRLRLTLFRDPDEETEEEIENENFGDEEEEEEDGDVVEDDFDEGSDGYIEEEEEEEEEVEEDDDEGVNGNIANVGGKMGMKKFQRPGKCKEIETEKKRMINWEAFWVATS